MTLTDRASVIPYAKKLQEMGARNVLVSLAGEGAALLAEDGNVYEGLATGEEIAALYRNIVA